MPLARINDQLLYFIHIPKTGGSSIEQYLRAKGKLALFQKHLHPWSRSSAQHMQAEVANLLIGEDFVDHSFTVLRDPMARLISEFKFQIMRARQPQGNLIRVPIGPKRLKLCRSLDFNTWARHVLSRSLKDPYLLDNHLRPQTAFLRPSARLFRYENGLEQVFRWIDEVTGTAPIDLTFHEKKSPNVVIEPSPKTLQLVQEIYAEDYRLLNGLNGARLQNEKGAPISGAPLSFIR